MKKSKFIAVAITLAIFLIPSTSIYAQNSVTVENFFGEGSFMDGYDFSANAVQRWGESGPDNSGLSPDFYLGDSYMPVTTTDYHSPKDTIDYGTTPLNDITEIPSQSDSRFANHSFTEDRTYGMFTLEGDYIVMQVLSLYEQPFGDWHKNGMTFNWVYVEGGLTGELTISLYPYDKTEFAMGESPTIGGDVLVGGQPLINAEVCIEVWGDATEYMYGACFYTDAAGQFSFWLEYGASIPTGYRGNLVVEGNVTHNGTTAEQVIYVPYGNEALDLPLDLVLIGPDHSIQIGGWEDISIAGTITSQGTNVDGAQVTMKVAGQTFQTTTGTHTSGKFNWYWANNSFPAGSYWVEVTITKDGYQSVTDSVAFTLLGEGYDYWVTMDPIPALLDPGDQVPFPGMLTLGGQPHYDWIEADVTFPNGRTNTYLYETGADGRFTHIQPSMNEVGAYQLVVFRYDNREQISDVYTFAVGAMPTPTVTPAPPQPTQAPRKCEIIDVVYPSMVLVGENVNVTGKVICTQDEEEIIPQEGWDIHVFDMYSSDKAPVVQTSGDGSFAAIFPSKLYIQEINILARDPVIETRYARWFGPLSVVVDVEPDISLSQTDYDQGEIVAGKLNLNPSSFAQDWDSGVEIFYQITGPVDGAAKQYLFESQYYSYTNIDGVRISTGGVNPFSWRVPPDAGGGKYTLTAYISGHYIAAQTVEKDFYVNDIQHTNLTAMVESDPEGWASGTLVGQYTDFDGVPVPNADVRVEFFIVTWNDEGTELIESREFKLTGTTNELGNYEINLEPLDLFVGQGQNDPWQPYWVPTNVYADKEGYATGAVIIDIRIPTAKARLEIISVNPPLDHLSKMAQSGMSYEQLTEMNISIRVRYNNIFTEGAKLGISAEGFWAVNGSEEDDLVIYEPYLSINGEQKPEWQAYKYGDWWGARQNMNAWPNGTLHPDWYYYPKHSVTMPAQHGIAQESTISVSGRLFGYHYCDECSPAIPPEWVGARPAVKIQIGLGNAKSGAWQYVWNGNNWIRIQTGFGDAKAVVVYNIRPPSISASGSAWVAPTGGEFNGKLNVGQATGFALHNQQVNLSIVTADIGVTEISTDTEKTTSGITIKPSAITDDKGKLKLPLTAKTNPCELEEKEKYYVKITTPVLNGNQYIPIELRCVKELKFELSDQDISVIQAVDLTDNNPIQLAAGKEAGVRVYIDVDGEIYQPENKPVQFDVKFEVLAGADNTPLFPQIKTVSLSEEGISVSWSSKSRPINDAGIGEILTWETTPGGESGRELVYVDFVFTPHQLGGSNTKFQIKITVDPDKVYGESATATKAGIKVKKMKRLQILFVPVDIESVPMSIILRQVNFLAQTYPLGDGDIGWGIAKNFPTAEMYRKWEFSQATLSWLGQIALNVGERYNSANDANVAYRVVGIISDETWAQNPLFGSENATGVYYGNGITLIRQSGSTPDNTLAHELGHSLGLYTSSIAKKIAALDPTFTGEQYEIYPAPGLPVSGYILRNSKIYLIPDNLSDASQLNWVGAFGGDPAKEKKLAVAKGATYSNSRSVSDLMGNALGGAQSSWVIPETYNHLFDKLKDPLGEQVLFIQGGVIAEDAIEFLPIWQSNGHPDAQSEEGDYALELRSSSDEILYRTLFTSQYGWPGNSAIFALRVPFKPGTARVVILDGSQIIGEVNRSSYPPEIQIVSQPIFSEDTPISLTWTASDPDGDAVTYSLYYQCDNPTFWFTLAADLTETSYSFDTSGLPGGESCVVRVMASDGFNNDETISDPFSVLSKVPVVQIFLEETPYETESMLLLKGIAYDPEDGIIPSENLTWFSDIDGELGVGSAISVMLSPGAHNLTLRAQDSAGNFSMANATIQVQSGEPLAGMGSGLQSLWLIGFVALAALVGIGVILLLWFILRKHRKTVPVVMQETSGQQPGTIQDKQGRWWYQDPNSGAWSIWNGSAWQPADRGLQPVLTTSQPPSQKSGSGSCLFTLVAAFIMAVIIVGAISLVALNFFPEYQLELGQGDLAEILKWGGGGALVSILGLFLLNGGFKAVITRRAIVDDEWGHRSEKRGCGAILNGLGQLFFGIILLTAGLGMMTMIFYQEVLHYFGF